MSNRVGSNPVLGKRGEGEGSSCSLATVLGCGGSHSMSQLTYWLGLAGVTLILPQQKELDKTLAIWMGECSTQPEPWLGSCGNPSCPGFPAGSCGHWHCPSDTGVTITACCWEDTGEAIQQGSRRGNCMAWGWVLSQALSALLCVLYYFVPNFGLVVCWREGVKLHLVSCLLMRV